MYFTYVNPTVIYFGRGQISAIKQAITPDQKVLVIYGGGSIKQNGVYQQVEKALEGRQWIEFAGVEPNPTKETLDNAIALAKAENVHFILAVGGGSVIDGAKFVAAATTYNGDSWDIMTGKHQVTHALALGAILTLPATGSESNAGAVITKAATQDKLAFINPIVQPKFAVLDPDVMKSLPLRQLKNGLIDAWVHTCEQYITTPSQAMVQDGYAETLLKNLLVLGNSIDKRDSDAWRANLMWTANQALNGLIGAGVAQDWATHMIGHELTALWGLDHAQTLAIIQPSLLRNQIEVKRLKLEQMGKHVFGLKLSADLAERTIDKIEDFYRQLGVKMPFVDHGMTQQQAVDAVINQLRSHGMVALGEAQRISLEISRQILTQAIGEEE